MKSHRGTSKEILLMYFSSMLKFITLLFVLISFSSISQKRATLERLQHDKEICKAFAEKSIIEINGGVLLVRLNFRQKQIDYLTKRNDTIAAKNIQKTALTKNKKITEAFSKKFNFCSVYFFKMSDSKYVRLQQFDSIALYDINLNVLSTDSIRLQSENYLIGEFNKIKQDTSYYSDVDQIDMSKENPKEKVYYGGSKNGREAFIIMDRKFQQIQKPFPYFSTLPSLLSDRVRFLKAIESINEKLHGYSRQVGTKEE